MNRTSIEWTNYSVNPLKLRMPDGSLINACVHKSSGCENCYAEAIVRRWWDKKKWGRFPGYVPALLKLGTPVLVDSELDAVLRLSKRITQGQADPAKNKVFWNDMTDESLDFWPDELLDQIWAIRALTPNLIHQVLTKRAERMYDYLRDWMSETGSIKRKYRICDHANIAPIDLNWPLFNVHLGVSVEDPKTFKERWPFLRDAPTWTRWISYEPALAGVDFSEALIENHYYCDEGTEDDPTPSHRCGPIANWIVVGGESGPGARPFDVQWAYSVIEQCKAAGVPCFIKQLGAKPTETLKHMPHGTCNHPLNLKDKKGGNWSEWPGDLRVREYPS